MLAPLLEPTKLLVLTCAWLSAACHGPAPRSATAEYLAGMEEAIERMQPKRIPTIIVTWDKHELELGQCRRIAGEAIVYLHVGVIVDRSKDVSEARALIADVLSHELGHAELTCTNADHGLLLPRAHKLSREEPSLRRSYVWETPYHARE